MSMKSVSDRRLWQRSVISAAVSLVVASSAVYAQQSAGSINGRAGKGDVITVENKSINITRQLKQDSDGNWQLTQLPGGTYQVTIVRANGKTEKTTVLVTAGQGATAAFADGAQTITVVGSAIRTIDVGSVNSSFTLSKAEIDRIPVASNVSAVTLLAPGATAGDGRFGNLASLGGASVAENAYYINGFNVTNILKGLAFNEVPFEAIADTSVKNGGYSAEYGRSLGGVISVTTKRGTDEWKGGASISHRPAALQGDSVYAEKSASGKWNLVKKPGGGGTDETMVNLYAGGPLIPQTLYGFALLQAERTETKTYGQDNHIFGKTTTPQYLVKLDWNINESNLLEFTAFNDESTRKEKSYSAVTPYTSDLGDYLFEDAYTTGGKNMIAKWTGYITSDLTVSAMAGKGTYSRANQIYASACPGVYDGRSGTLEYLGCWSEAAGLSVDDTGAKDERKAYRLDAEWVLGDHTLRAGLDREVYDTKDGAEYTGGAYYRLYTLANGRSVNGFVNDTGAPIDYVRYRVFKNGGVFQTKNSAWYIEDNFQITKNVLANFGIRNEAFTNLNDKGQPFVEVKNTWAPRLGVSWDASGDGSTKIYANAGRYYIPIYANTNVRLSGAETFYTEYYEFDGTFSADGKSVPGLGAQLGDRVTTSNGEPKDPRTVVDPNLKPMFQDEFIVGFQQALADRWTLGVKFTNRKLKSSMDDVCEGTLSEEWALTAGYTEEQAAAIGSTVGGCFLYNVGKDLTANVDLDGTGNLTEVVIPAAAMYIPKAKRDYRGLELTLDRQWDKRWSASASYVLAFSKGNTEGYVKSDIGQDDAGITQDFDHPGLAEGSDGYLPNDRRHTFKFNGAYALNDEWSFGATLLVQSGRPKNCFGNYPEKSDDPNYPYTPGPLERDDSDAYGAASFYCNGVLGPRGSKGRLGWTKDVSLQAGYTPMWMKGLNFKINVLNIFNSRAVRSISEQGEDDGAIGSPASDYQRPLLSGLQAPRTVKFSASYEF